jgi:hypothetical protein
MISDATHLSIFDAHQKELLNIIQAANAQTSGLTTKSDLIPIYLAQLDALTEAIRKQRRTLRWLNGEPIEPENHHIEAVISGFGGLEGF